MITAKKNPFLNAAIYRLLILSALRGSFQRVNVRQAAPPPDRAAGRPVILYGNHSTWWDGHLSMAFNETLWKMDAYVMFEENQLKRYPFFRAVGSFSIDRQNARSALQTLEYTVELLGGGPGRLVLIFPQGEIRANDERPIQFFSGCAHVARRAVERYGECDLYPLAMRCEFLGEQKPEAFISVGEPTHLSQADTPQTKALTAELQGNLTRTLDALRDDVTAYRLSSFQPLLRGGPSINRLFDRLLGREQLTEVGRRP